MRFSKKSEYGLRALLELTKYYEQRPLRRTEIAKSQQIPVGFLEGILLSLKHSGILASRPGSEGGFRLIKSPRDVSLGQIIRTLDGPLAPIACVSRTAYQTCQDCPYAQDFQCPIQSIMLEVRNAIAAVLDHYTLSDFSNSASLKSSRRLNSVRGKKNLSSRHGSTPEPTKPSAGRAKRINR